MRIETFSTVPDRPDRLDVVADLNGILQQQKQPGDEVLHQLLRTEADGDADDPGAGKQRATLTPISLSAVKPTTATIKRNSAVAHHRLKGTQPRRARVVAVSATAR